MWVITGRELTWLRRREENLPYPQRALRTPELNRWNREPRHRFRIRGY